MKKLRSLKSRFAEWIADAEMEHDAPPLTGRDRRMAWCAFLAGASIGHFDVMDTLRAGQQTDDADATAATLDRRREEILAEVDAFDDEP